MWLKKSVAIIDGMLKILDITRFIYIYIYIYVCMYVCMYVKRDLDLN